MVITGLSGSGKSTALKALEDLGFYAVDNLPAQLLPAFINLPVKLLEKPFRAALVMDLRDPEFVETFPATFQSLAQRGLPVELLFLEASEEALLRRYSQTRRQHPLAGPGESLSQGIERERQTLAPLRQMAHQVVDTSQFNIHQLRQEITRLFSQMAPPAHLQLNLISFGFKYGLPQESDLIMDMRFLANPFFDDQLRELDGLDQRVIDYVCQQEAAQFFLSRFKELLEFLLPRYRQEGKRHLTVALGCTGGRHRSVVIAEWLSREIRSTDYRVTVRHRDITLDTA